MQRYALLLALSFCTAIGCSNPQASQPPASVAAAHFPAGAAELTRHLALAATAETVTDRVARCLQYPDLPGNTWPAGSAKAMCDLLIEPDLSLPEIDGLLSGKDGGPALDRRFAVLRHASAQRPNNDRLYLEYSLFDGSEEARRIAEKWLAFSPHSAFAKTASAQAYLTSAMDARGQEYIHKTSAHQIAAMNRWLERARPLYEEALQADPQLSTACVGLAGIGRLQGDDVLVHRALAACDRIDGGSWYVLNARQIAAEDKWGGNAAMRRQLVEDAKARMSTYPILAAFIANVDAETPYALADAHHWQAAAPGLTQAAMTAPNALWLGYAGLAAQKAGDVRRTLVLLSQALRFSPDSPYFRQRRAAARRDSGDLVGAVADVQHVVELGRAKGSTYSLLGQLMLSTGRIAEAKAAFQQAMQDPVQHLWAFRRWCEVIITREHDVDGALACSKGLIDQYPDDTESLFMRAWVLAENKQPEAEDFAQRFFARADASDQRQAEMLQQLHQLRGDK